MKNLSEFVRNGFVAKKTTETYEYIDTIEGVDSIIEVLNCGNILSLKFKNTNLKNYFLDKISTIHPYCNVINCNCSIDKYYENNFSGYIIFNNIGRCRQIEILEDINKYKSIKLC